MIHISVAELKKKREAQSDFVLLDVREPDEIATASIDGATPIPMMDIPHRFAELPKDKDIVVLCHHGARSAQVTEYLHAVGFERVVNLDGGIDAWSQHVDPTVARY